MAQRGMRLCKYRVLQHELQVPFLAAGNFLASNERNKKLEEATRSPRHALACLSSRSDSGMRRMYSGSEGGMETRESWAWQQNKHARMKL